MTQARETVRGSHVYQEIVSEQEPQTLRYGGSSSTNQLVRAGSGFLAATVAVIVSLALVFGALGINSVIISRGYPTSIRGASRGECVSVWPDLCKFVDPLPVPASIDAATGDVLTMGAYRTVHKIHRDMPATPVYAFGPSEELATVPGPTLEAKRGIVTRVQWVNNITDAHYMLTVDTTLMWANPQLGGVPITPHLHGGEVESASDGNADAWWTNAGEKGPKYVKSLYTYANEQEPATLWYHDHTIGVTRLSVYLGLAGLYILRDPTGMESSLQLPSGEFELPLVIQDKQLREDGTLDFPLSGINPHVHPYWVPKFFGNFILVNGKAWPYMKVERRQYRFRILNACNARYLNITFVIIPEPNSKSIPIDFMLPDGALLPFHQIGSDGGYLNQPVELQYVYLGPGERADVIVDFSPLDLEETSVYIGNGAHVPNKKTDPNVRDNTVVMRFLVKETPLQKSEEVRALVASPKLPQILNSISEADPNSATFTRYIVMREYSVGGIPAISLLGERKWSDPVTETPTEGTTEIWTIINLTSGPHPMHFHLTAHRLLSRQPLDRERAEGGLCSVTNSSLPSCYTGPAMPPFPNEVGWKDTTDMPAASVTRILMRFTSQSGRPFGFDPTEGPGYAWHCHSLDHEDNEMMRPFVVLRAPPP